jgi:3-oxoacyl-(acyl-carrier-protein) synthase
MTVYGATGFAANSKTSELPVIKSMALLTPLGVTPAENWHAIVNDRQTLQRSVPVPEIEKLLIRRFPHTAHLPKIDRVVQIALLAAADALDQTDNPRLSEADGLFIATSKGPIQTMIRALANPLGVEAMDAELIALGPAAIGYHLRQQLGSPGEVHTLVAACAGSLAATSRAFNALLSNRFRRAVVVAADSSLHPMFDASFARLGVLAPADENGNRQCRPFDAAGRGFFMTEAAAAMVLEFSPVGDLHIEGTWLGGDATDLLATDSAARSLRRGISSLAGDTRIDFVHAHATGTRHDAHELAAISAIRPSYIFSHKRFLGHSLGASGLVALVLSAMCHRHQKTLLGDALPPSSTSLTLAQGFGGHIGVVRMHQSPCSMACRESLTS